MVEISIRASADDGSLESLLRWLGNDPELRAVAVLSPGYRTAPESMGGVLEAINILVGNATALMNLALAYASWRSQHATAAPIVVVLDGRQVTLSGEDGDEDAVRQITALAEQSRRQQGRTHAE
jgi:hypothetical protein